jgi:hypothetical protein
MPSTVFITNRADRHAYDSALNFGAICFITSGNYPIFKTSRLIEEIVEALAHSTPNDYLLFSGSATISGLCLAIWLEKHGKCKALLWDQRSYIQRDLERSKLRIEIERVRDRIETAKRGG